MIKALLRESAGQAVVVLGLSGENMGGRTEEDMAAQLKARFGTPKRAIRQEPER
ncbi:MAG TPA: hypothetical protein VI172_15605 [Candidatus Dormibacteraeota bacterium]|jgi:hypothetical protein